MGIGAEPVEMASNLLVLIIGFVTLIIFWAEYKNFAKGKLKGVFLKALFVVAFFLLNFLLVDGVHTLEPLGVHIVTSADTELIVELIGHMFQLGAFILAASAVFELRRLRK